MLCMIDCDRLRGASRLLRPGHATSQPGMRFWRNSYESLMKCYQLRPDVILMDIQMLRCDGPAATRLIKAEMPECRAAPPTSQECIANL
jgi:CheY-like chemotaxis protein